MISHSSRNYFSTTPALKKFTVKAALHDIISTVTSQEVEYPPWWTLVFQLTSTKLFQPTKWHVTLSNWFYFFGLASSYANKELNPWFLMPFIGLTFVIPKKFLEEGFCFSSHTGFSSIGKSGSTAFMGSMFPVLSKSTYKPVVMIYSKYVFGFVPLLEQRS